VFGGHGPIENRISSFIYPFKVLNHCHFLMVSSIPSPVNRHHKKVRLSESRRTSPHDFTLTNEFSVKFAPIEGEVDVEIDTVKRSLGSIHPFEVFLEILPREIRCKGDNFLDTWIFGIFRTNIFIASIPVKYSYRRANVSRSVSRSKSVSSARSHQELHWCMRTSCTLAMKMFVLNIPKIHASRKLSPLHLISLGRISRKTSNGWILPRGRFTVSISISTSPSMAANLTLSLFVRVKSWGDVPQDSDSRTVSWCRLTGDGIEIP